MATAMLITPTPAFTLSALRLPTTFSPTEIYPSSPMSCLPRPGALSKTLRERSGLVLSLAIARDSPPKGDVQPTSTNLPRRRRTKNTTTATTTTPSPKSGSTTVVSIQLPKSEEPKQVLVMSPVEIEAPVSIPPPAALSAPKVEEVHLVEEPTQLVAVAPPPKPDSSLQELIPGLYIAFSNDSPTQHGNQPGHSQEKPYTHILNIIHPTHDVDENFKGSARESYDHSVRSLQLVLPQAAVIRMKDGQRAGLGLTEMQLRVARDFLAGALPQSLASSEDQSSVRVLVTTPFGRPTDAMCAVGCYLGFASGQGVETILRFVDEEEEFLSVWKGEVSEEEVERAERVARGLEGVSEVAAVSQVSVKTSVKSSSKPRRRAPPLVS